MDIELIVTADGSPTLLLKGTNESYHSHFGAIQESKHVFIMAGLDYKLREKQSTSNTISILEIGMGTGLNVLLSLLYKDSLEFMQFKYTALEPFPIDVSYIKQLNYSTLANAISYQPVFEFIHTMDWDYFIEINKGFHLKKTHSTLQDFTTNETYDIVFFDAFSPNISPDMWSQEIFDKLFKLITPGGVLVTYCAKGIVKRCLKAAGFKVENLPGPPGKREMIRANK